LENGADPNSAVVKTAADYIDSDEINKLLQERKEKIALVTQLTAAIKDNKTNEVKLLLEKGADPNAKNALHEAVINGSAEIVNLLLKHGAHINRLDLNGQNSPLAYACGCAGKIPNFEMVKLLLEKGADPNFVKHYYKSTPLHFAAQSGSAEIVKLLIENKAKVDQRALEFACGFGTQDYYKPNSEVVKLLLQNGVVDINKKNEYGRTPLIIACIAKNGQIDAEFVKFLLRMGADPNIADSGAGYSSLQHNIRARGSPEIFNLLVIEGAQIKTLNSRYKRCAMALACGYSSNLPNPTVAKLLLKNGVNPNYSYYGTPFLNYAAYHGSVELIKLLLEKGAKVNKTDGNFESPLEAACWKGNTEAVKVLLEHGAKPNLWGGSPLHTAIKQGSVEIVKSLLEHGAKVNKLDGSYGTPLERAWYTTPPNAEIIKLLLDKGADPNITIKWSGGDSLLHLAVKDRNMEIVKLLIDKGANRQASLEWAKRNNHADLVELLEKK